MAPVYLSDIGAICAIGIGPGQCSASFRACLSGYIQSPVLGRMGEPLLMALVPECDLEPLAHALESLSLSDRERRMLRLGGTALRQVKERLTPALPMFLALPEPNPGQRAYNQRAFLEHLSTQAEIPIDIQASRYFELGRAGGLFALQAGVEAIRAGSSTVVVAGIDTCVDLSWLSRLDQERRLLGADVKDGFVPGEGAAVLVLSRSSSAGVSDPAVIAAVGTAEDPGHRYSETPALGIGLSAALDHALTQLGQAETVKTCFAGLNGESFGAKEWGVANIRHHALFDSALAFEHPADCFGDVGAAMGPLLIALADETRRGGYRSAPMLIWASSDAAQRACAYLTTR